MYFPQLTVISPPCQATDEGEGKAQPLERSPRNAGIALLRASRRLMI